MNCYRTTGCTYLLLYWMIDACDCRPFFIVKLKAETKRSQTVKRKKKSECMARLIYPGNSACNQKHKLQSHKPKLHKLNIRYTNSEWVTHLHSQLHKLRMSYTKSKYGLNRASKASKVSNILCPITFSYQDDFRYILCFGHDLKSWGHAEIGQNLQMYSALASLHGLGWPHHQGNFSC